MVTSSEPRSRPLTVVGFGGNALLQPDDLGTLDEQLGRAEEVARVLVEIVRFGHDLLVVHGNGPQVGQVLIQMEEAATKVPAGTVDLAVAQTEGSMGYLLELALRNALREAAVERDVATTLSLVVVDGDDAAFRAPSKPIGPFFPAFRARQLQQEQSWVMVEDSGRGWRKVVASPRPIEVLGLAAVRQLLAHDHVVIAGGGGGIPVVRSPEGLTGVEAVIDKDRTSSLLAVALRADALVFVTGVDRVYRDFGTEEAQPLDELAVERARAMLRDGEFPPGSMGPKIESAIEFVERGRGRALITDGAHLAAAVRGEAGTAIVVG